MSLDWYPPLEARGRSPSTVVAPQPRAAVRLASAFVNNRPTERPRLFVDRTKRFGAPYHFSASRSLLFFSSSRSRLLIAMSVCGTVPVAESPRARTSTSRQPTAVSTRSQKQPDPGRASFLSHAKCACYSAGGPNFRGAPGVGSQQPGQHSAHHRRRPARGGRSAQASVNRHESLSLRICLVYSPLATPQPAHCPLTPFCISFLIYKLHLVKIR